MTLESIIIGFAFGWLVMTVLEMLLRWAATKHVERLLAQQRANSPVIKQLTLPKYSIEKIGDVLYMWELPSNTFVAQGSTPAELAQSVQKYRGVEVALALYDDALLLFKHGQVAVYRENKNTQAA